MERPQKSLPAIRVQKQLANKRIEAAKDAEGIYVVSPSTPLLSTAIDENSLVCGQNDRGQLGVGGTADVLEPQSLQVVRRWAAISIGEGHSAGVSGEGECYTWGQNQCGQLGWAIGEPKDVPMKMDILRGWDVRAIACGSAHTVAITPDDVISWGCNSSGQTGQGERAEPNWVKPRSLKPLQGLYVTQVVCGLNHTLCVTATSQVFAWGDNTCGQLGLSDTLNRRAPTALEALWAIPVAQLAAGDTHSAALTINGFLFTWGDNERGQLGLPSVAEQSAQTQRTDSERRQQRRNVNQRFLSTLTEMGISTEEAEIALTETGNVGVEVATEWLYSVPAHIKESVQGREDPSTPIQDKEEALDERKHSMAPRRVALQGVRTVAAGGQHTVAVTDTQVFAWGSNSSGQLGTRTFKDKASPSEVKDLSKQNIVQVACGSEHTLFLSRDGEVYGCGSTKHGQLPFLKFSQPDDGPGSLNHTRESSTPRDEITQATCLKLPMIQDRGGKGPVVSSVAAGGNSSAFLTRAPDEFPSTPDLQLYDRLQNCIAEAEAEANANPPSSKQLKNLIAAIDMVFGSAAALSATFGHKEGVGINAELLEEMQEKILTIYTKGGSDAKKTEHLLPLKHTVEATLTRATNQLIDDLSRNVRLLGTPERAQVVLAAIQSPLLNERKDRAPPLLPRVCTVVLSSPQSCRQTLVKWWSEFPADLLLRRVVRPLQKYLTEELSSTKKLTVSVMNSIKVLSKVEEANQLGRQLPPEAFYNELISEKLDVEDHYVAWRQAHDDPRHSAGTEGPFSFCSYPFLLSPRAKSKLLHVEARFNMTQSVASSRHEISLGRYSQSDQRILPDHKEPLRRLTAEARKNAGGASASKGSHQRKRSQSRPQRGLQYFLHNMFRNNDGSIQVTSAEQPDYSVDERRMLGREMTQNRHSNPGSPKEILRGELDSLSLSRQGSMNLPTPEESGVPATHPDICIFRIRRNHLMEDALSEISRQRQRDLTKPLRVHFIGEDGIDAGGVKKEFFQLLVTELLCPDYGMLVYQQESGTFWFNAASIEDKDAFIFMGLVVGLAIYNAVLLDCPFPQALYRKLLGQQCTLRDLDDMDGVLGKSLGHLLSYDGKESVENVFCQTMTASQAAVGEVLSVPLCEGGESIMVTEENRREFVELYVDYILNKSVETQFEGFAKGFMLLCGGPALHLFSATELERLVCGNPILDFKELQANARYEAGFGPEHRVVKWLWEVVHEFTEDEQRHFLKFFTGSDRAPIGGLGNQRCLIQRDGGHSDKLPRSHTCFNTLLLPSYKDKEILKHCLRLAIMNSEGFGLE